MKKLILLVSLLLASCAALPNNFTVVRGTSQPATERPIPTASQIPTPTIDIQATMQVNQQDRLNNGNTEIALQSLIISATQTKEANDVLLAQAQAQEAQANAQAEQKKFDTAALIYSGNQTAQAYQQTAIPLTVQAQKTNVPLIAAMLEATAQAPRNAQIIAAAEAQQKTWWVFPMLSIFAVMFLSGLLVYMFKRRDEPKEAEDIPNLDPIPFTAPTPTTRKRIHTDIPCSPSVLLEFADSILHRGMTLAIKQWEGTIVHKRMVNNALRSFMVSNDFAKPLQGEELDLLDAGKWWLEDVWELQAPPLPYRCIENDTPPIS